MTTDDPPSIVTALRSALTSAMKQRDGEATAVYRGALSAIDNAGAQPVSSEHQGHAAEGSAVGVGTDGSAVGVGSEGSAFGVGSTDVPRRALTEKDLIGIVVSDANESQAAAEVLETVDPSRAQQLCRGADLLLTLVLALNDN